MSDGRKLEPKVKIWYSVALELKSFCEDVHCRHCPFSNDGNCYIDSPFTWNLGKMVAPTVDAVEVVSCKDCSHGERRDEDGKA